MSDLISRQDAIDALEGEIEVVGKANAKAVLKYTKMVCDRIKALPSVQPEPRWIPVTERLPENIKPVIVTWENTDPKSYYQYIVGKHFIGTAHYKSGKWYWYSSVTEDLLAEYGRCDSEELDEAIKVLAWMPLPEPYREEAEDATD